MRLCLPPLSLLACSATGPVLTELTPPHGPPGATVQATGERLCGAAVDCANAGGYVTFGLEFPTHRAQLLAATPTTLAFTVPDMAQGPTEVFVTVGNQTSNALPFVITP